MLDLDKLNMPLAVIPPCSQQMLWAAFLYDRAPHQDTAVHALGQEQVTVPPHTVYIVPVYLGTNNLSSFCSDFKSICETYSLQTKLLI